MTKTRTAVSGGTAAKFDHWEAVARDTARHELATSEPSVARAQWDALIALRLPCPVLGSPTERQRAMANSAFAAVLDEFARRARPRQGRR